MLSLNNSSWFCQDLSINPYFVQKAIIRLSSIMEEKFKTMSQPLLRQLSTEQADFLLRSPYSQSLTIIALSQLMQKNNMRKIHNLVLADLEYSWTSGSRELQTKLCVQQGLHIDSPSIAQVHCKSPENTCSHPSNLLLSLFFSVLFFSSDSPSFSVI